jgi:predicted aconitase
MEVFVGIDAARAIGPGCAGRAVKRRAAWSSPGLVAIVLLGAALGATGCQAMQTQRQNTPEMIQQGNTMLDRQRILMSTGGLDDPYDKLGDLSYSEPFSPDAIDSTHINEKLRDLALAKWGRQVDAIVHITTKVGGDGSTLTVSATAVRIKSDTCSYCRHNHASPTMGPGTSMPVPD